MMLSTFKKKTNNSFGPFVVMIILIFLVFSTTAFSAIDNDGRNINLLTVDATTGASKDIKPVGEDRKTAVSLVTVSDLK